MDETKKIKKINKNFKWFLLIFALLGVAFFKEDSQQKFIGFFNNLTSKEIDIQLDKQYNGVNLNYFDETLIKWEDNSISFLDYNGSVKWKKNFDFAEPEVIFSDKIIYILDKYLGDIYLLNNQGDTISKIQLNIPIFSIKESNDNLLIHIKEFSTESLNIIYKGENQVDELVSVEDNILTYSLNKDSSKYAYSSIELRDSEIISKIIVSSTKGTEEYSLEIPNEIIISTEFINNQIIVVTDSTLNIVENGEIKTSKEYPLIKDVLINNNEIYLLYGDNIEVLDLKGEVKNKITFGLDYKRIVPVGNYIVLYGNKDVIILKDSKEVLRYKAEEDIISVVGNNNHIALQYTDKMQIFKFINKDKID